MIIIGTLSGNYQHDLPKLSEGAGNREVEVHCPDPDCWAMIKGRIGDVVECPECGRIVEIE